MPSAAFLMTGAATPFRPAEPCPVMAGPHHARPDRQSFLVADVVTRDGTARARVAAWRCAECGVLLIGIGQAGIPVDTEPGTGVHSQEFTWLQETVALLGG